MDALTTFARLCRLPRHVGWCCSLQGSTTATATGTLMATVMTITMTVTHSCRQAAPQHRQQPLLLLPYLGTTNTWVAWWGPMGVCHARSGTSAARAHARLVCAPCHPTSPISALTTDVISFGMPSSAWLLSADTFPVEVKLCCRHDSLKECPSGRQLCGCCWGANAAQCTSCTCS
jgi:hypothetical protein